MSQKYRAEQTVSISAFESGDELEVLMVVTFTVHPGCKQTTTEPAEMPSAEVSQRGFFKVKNGKPLPQPVSMPDWIIDGLIDGDGFEEWLLSEANEQREMAICDAADARREMTMEDRL
jgi:hypothetical protein